MGNDSLLMAFYGDDFTGSTDALEVLEGQGLRTVLFIKPPSEEMLKFFPQARCIGVAGTSRTMSPAAMERNLAPDLEKLWKRNPRVLYYKICSTADSSPEIGSIGKVLEIGKRLYADQGAIPILVAAPQLRRYTVFGNHFAAYQSEVYRLDRHPSMSRHPVTPMKEADLLRHFSGQMNGTISLFSFTDLELPDEERERRWDQLFGSEQNAVLIDALNEGHISTVGRLLGESAERRPMFVIGSSGVAHALGSYWRARYALEDRPEPVLDPGQTLVLSGSCSPVTYAQIDEAVRNGFRKIKVDVLRLLGAEESESERDRLMQETRRVWLEGRNVILYTADGPEEASIHQLHDALGREGASVSETGRLIGTFLGQIGKSLIRELGVQRLVLAGGDTSGFAALTIGIDALELLQRTAPGAPLCTGHSGDKNINGIQLALKGGQLGQPDYFVRVANGGRGWRN
jgi:uncharacterized protein YgbK (DUF1537 family)